MFTGHPVNHPFHLTDESPWPILASFLSLGVTVGLVSWFHMNSMALFCFSFLTLNVTSFLWWRDISREGAFQGLHTMMVFAGLRWGMLLFITSEVFFFLSFFWAFFHSALSPNIEVGSSWPPLGIQAFNPWGVPLLNTVVLLSSGISVTWSHKGYLENNHNQCFVSLTLTIFLGLYFTILQGMEYQEASFSISDSVFGSTFFIATGFHGLHVIVGTLFLIVGAFRLKQGMLSKGHHLGLTAAIWYWHFVDVVWLFLFSWLYVWTF